MPTGVTRTGSRRAPAGRDPVSGGDRITDLSVGRVPGEAKPRRRATELKTAAGELVDPREVNAELEARDALGAFEWRCLEVDGVVHFYSFAFAHDKGLGDLLTSDGWLENSLEVIHRVSV